MSLLENNNFPQLLGRIQTHHGHSPEIGVISLKYNPEFFANSKGIINVPLTIKKIDPKNLSCRKLQSYYEQGRLAVIVRNKKGNRFLCSNDLLPNNVPTIRVITKKKAFTGQKPSNSNLLEQKHVNPFNDFDPLSEIRDSVLFESMKNIVFEKLSKEDYLELFDYCLKVIEACPQQNVDDKSISKEKEKKQYSLALEYDARLKSAIKGFIGFTLIKTINDIIANHYEIMREADIEEATRREEDIRYYERVRDQILYQVKIFLIKSEDEEKIVERLDIVKSFLRLAATINLL
ncbi:MAG: hypothetical protein VX777_04500 [Chlamydiota bacterium]|nr:hypothetical protein [Chlamydiota bacterium]